MFGRHLNAHMYQLRLPEVKNLPRSTPGPIIDDLERRIGTNTSKRSLGRSILVHSKAKENKCDRSWSYLSSYIYHQPRPDSQKSRNLPRTPPGAKTLPLSDKYQTKPRSKR